MLWDVLTATGGAVALTLIVAIALGISAMTLLFAGSAVVVLERFARAARRTRTLVGCGALWSLVVGAAAIELQAAELAALPLREKALAWGVALTWSAALVAVAMCVARLGLRWVRPAHLAIATLLLMGLGASAVLGGTGCSAAAAGCCTRPPRRSWLREARCCSAGAAPGAPIPRWARRSPCCACSRVRWPWAWWWRWHSPVRYPTWPLRALCS
jgi:hypothetical protein